MMGKKIAKLSLLCVLALLAFLIESLLPPLFIPGAKLGLGNVFILVALVLFGYKESLVVVIAKSLLAGIFGGNPFSIAFSFTAGAISVTVSYLLLRFFKNELSYPAISSASSVTHNLVQLTVFIVMNGNFSIAVYAPYLTLIGMASGAITGLLAHFLINFFENHSGSFSVKHIDDKANSRKEDISDT